TNENYKLLIVGKGRLREKLDSITLDRNLENRVKIINSISNKDIWQVYRISSFFVNLSRNEIFGMAIMEAMYYECCVVAIKAPGPQYIIEHKKSGYLCENYNEVVDCMLKANTLLGKEAHNRIEKDFNWAKTSEIILNEIQN
ncbi:glycosyltransferase, partial [Terribacillus saccharophilus]|uniref:glycosyltransferase n=1 Tax=Terribacillus saccharophilus TaxID=361277 RepID=UPI002DC2A1C4|nr:glycosyltransferase [Terribacillus saccharophilus]